MVATPERPPDRIDDNAWRSRDDEALDAMLLRGGAAPPSSFATRGVAVPFTTPMLAQSRVRRAGSGVAPELVIANAVGHRGWYVVPWDGVPALAPLTLHDRVLHATLASLWQPSPEAVRAAARGAARSGLAGRAAMAATIRAEEAEHQAVGRTRAELLVRLLATTGLRNGAVLAEQLDSRAQIAIEAMAAHARMAPSRVFASLDQLSAALAPLGGPTQHQDAPVQRALHSLVQLRAALEDRAERTETDAARVAAHLVRITTLFERCARRTLTAALAGVGDLPTVLVRWHRSDFQVPAMLSRPAWVLDGWADLAALWQSANAAGEPERPTLARLIELAPALPTEAEAWIGEKIVFPNGRPRGMGDGQDWRDQALLMQRTARHEAMRTLVP